MLDRYEIFTTRFRRGSHLVRCGNASAKPDSGPRAKAIGESVSQRTGQAGAPRARSSIRGRLEKCEIAALVGAENFPGIELGVATRRDLGCRLGGGCAPLELGVIDQEIDTPRA